MPEGGTGDVKYHHGASGTRTTQSGKGVTVTLSPNPSHLEFVDPVVEGRARADQSSRKRRELSHDPTIVLPVLVHGDAAFPGQGIVAETLNLQALEGYTTGGTIHLITNNQIGFTTEPSESRSTRYASDLAKGFDIPIIHVNADDVEALHRRRPARDGVPRALRPRRRDRPDRLPPLRPQRAGRARLHAAADVRGDQAHPPVRKLYADQLIDAGVIDTAEAERMAAEALQRLATSHEELKASIAQGDDEDQRELDRSPSPEPRTAVGRGHAPHASTTS